MPQAEGVFPKQKDFPLIAQIIAEKNIRRRLMLIINCRLVMSHCDDT